MPKQTFSDFEFIIINDGSTDKSHEIIKPFVEKDKRILTRWCRAIDKHEAENSQSSWNEMEEYRKEWLIEWRVAKGELSENTERTRKENWPRFLPA